MVDPNPSPRPYRIALGSAVRAFMPAPFMVDARERWRAVAGAGIGIACVAVLARLLAGGGWHLGLIAPIGASAVLVFATPASPLAQPWSVLGGNLVSALIGLACARAVPDPTLAGPLAVAAAIGAMFALRCLHPPGAAIALSMVLGPAGPAGLAVATIAADSLLIVLSGMAYNHATGRRYPHPQRPAPAGPAEPGARFSAADLDAALAHYNQVLDVSRDDLEALLHEAELHAYRRSLGGLRCADIMSTPPVTVQFGTPLAEAWTVMRTRRIKALPVTDRGGRIAGILTLADFMRMADLDAGPTGIAERLRLFLRKTGLVHSDHPEVVGQVMTRAVRVASAERAVVELVPLFSEGGHHHIPIIDADGQVVGVITQTDLVRALYRAVQVAPASA